MQHSRLLSLCTAERNRNAAARCPRRPEQRSQPHRKHAGQLGRRSGRKPSTLTSGLRTAYTNHYSKSLNQCFVLVEYHYGIGDAPSWSNSISLWNVYENSQYGTYLESHLIYLKPKYTSESLVSNCEVVGKKCKTLDEF